VSSLKSQRAVLLTSGFILLASCALFAQVPNPSPIIISPRRVAAYGAAILSALLLLQWAHRRRSFILLWAAGWLLVAPEMLILTRAYATPWVARAAVGAAQLLDAAHAAFFLWSADVFRQTGYVRRRHLRYLAPVALWFLVAPTVAGTWTVLAPGYLLSGMLLAIAATMYGAVLLERRMIGAGLIGLVLLGLAVTDVTTAVSLPRAIASSQFGFDIFLANALLTVFGASASTC
jgi:hypothetical protein